MKTTAYTSKDAYSLDDLPEYGSPIYWVNNNTPYGRFRVWPVEWWPVEWDYSVSTDLALGLIHRTHESAKACCDMLNGKVGEKLAKETVAMSLGTAAEKRQSKALRTLLQLDD